MKILLYGINFAPELIGIGKYSGEMVEFLSEQGHQLTVVTAPPYYPQWEIQKPYKRWTYKVETLLGAKVIRCPMYVPEAPKTMTRMLHLFHFAVSSFFGLFSQIFTPPDVIIVVEPTLFCAPATLLFSRLTGAKAWLHIQDFEIDAMFGLGMAANASFLRRWIYYCETWMLKRFDKVSSISQSMLNLAGEKGVAADKLCFFPNWADIDAMQPLPDDTTYRKLWKIPANDVVLLYSGNIGKKQGLEMVLRAARHFADRSDIHFIIVGDGAHRNVLEDKAEGLSNVHFRPFQPYDNLAQLMAVADVHLVIQKAGAADLVLPSKLATILAVGSYSIITADKGTALGDFCEANPGIAQRVPPEDTAAFIAAIQQTLMMINEREPVNTLARQYAEKFIEKKAVLSQFESDLQSLVDNA